MRAIKIITVISSAILAAACGRSWTPENPGSCVFDSDCFEGWVCVNGRCLDLDLGGEDGGIRLKEFGEPCEDNLECLSDYCLAHTGGGFCTQLCADGCPSGFVCKRVPDPHGGTERVGLCALDRNRLCKECAEDLDCNPTGSDLCMQIGAGTYCLTDCWYTTCPAGYDCVDVTAGGGALRQCQPAALVCSCTQETAGMLRGCQRDNQLGVCSGYEECLPPEGWTDCSAREPTEEECNGIDDECDGRVDEELVGNICALSNQYGTCDGEELCRGFEGWVCGAPEPGPEDCDLVDNDCDFETDEDFRDIQGRYVDDAHCGGCGVDCSQMIPHALAAECRLVDEQPVCRATECESGYFVYAEGLACLALPANLCRVCSSDEDCLAPGSRCIENGTEHYCSRDCSSGSPYGPGCPAGYACRPYQTAMQCQPESNTCLCTAETLGTARSCLVDTCTGYQECRQNGTLFEWSDCNIEDFNTEICDGEDNNCDGLIDEGYLNPLTGKYDSNDHCGFCNNDCSKYWSEPIDHTVGICQVPAQGMPMCVMGPCSTETENGITYEWVDVNLDSADGCECRRVLGNTDTDPPDLIGYPQPGLTYLDENCDGIDGVITDALFVRAGADAPGNGSLASPYPSISQAINAFMTSGKSYILVAEGTYDETVRIMGEGMELHGGYSADFLSRDVALYQSVIEGQRHSESALDIGPVQDSSALVSGFVIRGRDVLEAPGPNDNGMPSMAVLIKHSESLVELRSNVIVAGRGGDGARGQSGAAGYGRQDSAALDGGAGRNGQRRSGACAAGTSRAGGAGGQNAVCAGTGGNPGGGSVCPVFDWSSDPVRGNQAEYTSSAGGNGLGGYDWSFDEKSGSTCSHATESGFPSDHQLNVGQDGRDGGDGTNGLGGAGEAGGYGSIRQNSWAPSPLTAEAGTGGSTGGGGGGGGAGGGTARWYNNWGDCDAYEIGPTGGGGGAGGCGGGGGYPGRTGGASIAVMLVECTPVISFNLIERGQGGAGGDGGFGGMGGLGGAGGFGGEPPDWISSLGGKGGDGGNGGPGGGGGGGAGGPSYGILGFDSPVAGYAGENIFVYDDTVPTAGAGGEGGGSVGVGASGKAGVDGAYRNILELITCPAAGCPSGTVCDLNNVCIPD